MIRQDASAANYSPLLLFYANIPPFWLSSPATGHLWSLGVEMQFYVAVAVLCLVFGRRRLLTLPLLCLAVTLNRILHGQTISIVTWFRVDEILSGATLALLMHLPGSEKFRRLLLPLSPYLLMTLLVASCHPGLPWLNYARPYLAPSLVGCTLVRQRGLVSDVLQSSHLRSIAKIFYALYVLHELMMVGWLGSGSKLIKYAKRPLCIALAFLAAHLSTTFYEGPWIELGKRLSKRSSSPVLSTTNRHALARDM